MPITLKRIVPVCGLTLAIAASAYGQAADQPRQQPPSQQPSAQQPSPQPASPAAQAQKPAAQIARGELQSIDATAKELTIKPTEGAEQKFKYTDSTKVTGGQGGVAGLATLSGRQVVVHFSMQGADRVASEIEVQAGASAPAPGARPGAGLPAPGERPGADRPDADKPGPDR